MNQHIMHSPQRTLHDVFHNIPTQVIHSPSSVKTSQAYVRAMKSLQERIRQVQDELSSKQKTITQLRLQVSQLKVGIQRLHEDIQEKEQGYSEEIQNLEQQLNNSRRQLTKLNEELLLSASKLKSHSHLLQHLHQHSANLEQTQHIRLQQLHLAQMKASQQNLQIQKLQNMNSSLQAQCERMSRQNSSLREDQQKSQERLSKCLKEKKQLQSAMGVQESEHSSNSSQSRAKIQQLSCLIQRLQNSNRIKDAQIATLQNKIRIANQFFLQFVQPPLSVQKLIQELQVEYQQIARQLLSKDESTQLKRALELEMKDKEIKALQLAYRKPSRFA